MTDQELIQKLLKLKTAFLKIKDLKRQIETLEKESEPLLDELLVYPEGKELIQFYKDPELYYKNTGTLTVAKPAKERKSSTVVYHKTMAAALSSQQPFGVLFESLKKSNPDLTEEQLKTDIEIYKGRGRIKVDKAGGKTVFVWVPATKD